ncbi:hypothetical protein [Pseudophaeobacter leonis]|uniref:hypothetical protein n=1 Tax=Pseudophaeobacter leonis TaxID=1144477 RepID=UPI0019D369B7|nr:hypothetical protein [Pseudophaeobacter leonis]
MRLCLLCLVSLLAGCMGRGSDPDRLPPPNVPTDLVTPVQAILARCRQLRAELSNALIAEAQGRGCANGKLATVAEILEGSRSM